MKEYDRNLQVCVCGGGAAHYYLGGENLKVNGK